MPIEILHRESQPLFEACRNAIAERHRLFAKQHPMAMHHMVLAPRTRKEAGFKVEVFSDEHPPPHFRIKYQQRSANYSIATCERLNGDLDLKDRVVRNWWVEHRELIAKA